MNLDFTRKHQFKPKPDKYCALGRLMDRKFDELNCSMYQFSKTAGVSHSYISHIMRGDFPNSPQIPKLMKLLGITETMVREEEQRKTA